MGNKARGIILGALGKLQKSITFDKCGRNKTFYDGVRHGIKLSKKAIESIPKTELHSDKWISVNDRLPDPYVKVLTFRQSFDDRPSKISINQTFMLPDGALAWIDDFQTWKSVVTHWAPLPKPPKGE